MGGRFLTEASLQALSILRSPDHFQWYLVPFLAFVLYVYMSEVQLGRWRIVFTGLLFAAAEFCWEILNALVLHFSGYAAVWSAPADSAFLILVGLNIEIYMMFVMAGVIVLKSLPQDRDLKICGFSNRLFIPLAWGLFCVFVEVLLNQWGALIWDYRWWCWPHIYLILIGYTAPFLAITWVYDRFSMRSIRIALAVFLSIDVIGWLVFVVGLKWI